MLSIPCVPNGQPRFTQRTALEGRDYLLTFDWSQREGKWRLDVADQSGDPIRSGIALLTGQPLLAGVTDVRRPPGELIITDTMGRDEPGFADLGARFALIYYAVAELA